MKETSKITDLFLKLLFSAVLILAAIPMKAQEDARKASRQARDLMQEAQEALEEEDFASAEAHYREAIAKDPSNAAARYNLGNLYHNEDLSGEAVGRHAEAAEIAEEKLLKHRAFHNQGNDFMKQKNYAGAVEAYKNALRNNPKDEETRYNLALAKEKLKKEQPKDSGDENKDKNKGDKENKEQENKDQQGDQGEQDQQGDPKDQENGDKEEEQKKDPKEEGEGEQNKDQQQDQGKKPEDEQQQQQPVPGQLSPQQIKNLLEAMGNEEKKVQEKMNAEKVKGAPTRAEKDW